jgi:hypothetical protein
VAAFERDTLFSDLPSVLVDGTVELIRGNAPTVTNGSASVAQTLRLPRNAVAAAPFPVTLRVTPGEWFLAADVAQLRAGGAPVGSGINVVVDFGVARTASAVAVLDTGLTITNAHRWLGASFEEDSLFDFERFELGAARAFASEVRTERLIVTVNGASSIDVLRPALAVQLPELPADLDLRVDGGPPIWTSPGTVTAGDLPADTPPLRLAPGKPASGAPRWRRVGGDLVQVLDLQDVLSALVGDPDAGPDDEREITLALTSRIPGAIALTVPASPASLLRYRARITAGFVDGRRDVPFSAEGLATVPLALPPWALALHSASVTLAATCDATRTVPPVGPDADVLASGDAPGGASGVPAAELVLDAERSMALPLGTGLGLQQLSAVRVPLRAGKSGCELRGVLLGADAVDPTAPGPALDGGAGKPTTVDGAAAEQWVTLPLQSPFTLPLEGQVFVALHVARGSATLAAARVGTGAPSEGVVEVWRGAPTGPWERLPDGAALTGLRGRLRLVGTAPGDHPIAPLRAAMGRMPTPADGVTPSPKGVTVTLTAGSGGTSDLQLVALTPCTVSVRDAIVTVSR